MKKKINLETLCTPQSKQPLVRRGNRFITADGRERFPIVFGVPILLPRSDAADWHRELVEMILWEHPDEIEQIYANEEAWRKDPNGLYRDYIRRLVGGKEEIRQAIDRYAAADTGQWLPQKNSRQTIPWKEKRDFLNYATVKNGKHRLMTAQTSPSKAAYHYYGETVAQCGAKSILELSTGAGTGTSLAANAMADDARLYTVDIGFSCHGNAAGIAKHLRKSIQPVCANFWYLPFRDEAFDLVCTLNGLDESREIQRTLSQTARVLKAGGHFLVFSRKSAFMRQRGVLEEFGFSQRETEDCLQKCRLYASAEHLIGLCREHRLALISSKEFVKDETTTWVVSLFQKGNNPEKICENS